MYECNHCGRCLNGPVRLAFGEEPPVCFGSPEEWEEVILAEGLREMKERYSLSEEEKALLEKAAAALEEQIFVE